MKNYKIILLVSVLILFLILLFIPIPYYQKEDAMCQPYQPQGLPLDITPGYSIYLSTAS